MTSKSSYSDHASLYALMREDLKRRLWPSALSILGNIFALPVLALLLLNGWQENIKARTATIAEVRTLFCLEVSSCGNIAVLLLICGLALINGIQGMSYLHSRIKCDLYDALPVKRSRMFTAVYLNGILIFALPYIVFHILTVVMAMAKGFAESSGMLYGALSVPLIIIFYSAIYTLVVLAVLLTGNTVISIPAAFVTTCIAAVYYGVFYTYREHFFMTFYPGDRYYYNDELSFLSPVTALIPLRQHVNDLSYGKGAGIFEGLYKVGGIYLALTLLLYLLCRRLYVLRPSESAGRAIAFSRTKPFIKVIVLIPLTLISALIFYIVSDRKWTWLVFGFAAGVLIGHAVIEIMFEFDFRACIRHGGSLLTGAVLSAAVICAFVFDPFGYDSYIPQIQRVSSIGLYTYALHRNLDYPGLYDPDEYQYYESVSDIRLRRMELKDCTEQVNTLVKNGIEYAKALRLANAFNIGDIQNMIGTEKEVEYLRSRGINMPDTENGYVPAYNQTVVCFRLTDGRKVFRSYQVDYNDREIRAALSVIYSDPAYKEAVYPELTTENDELGEFLVYMDPYSEQPIEDSYRKALLDAYKKETWQQKLSSLSDEYPIGCMVSQTRHKEYDIYEPQYYMYIYPSYKETIALLEKAGLKPLELYSPEFISEIDVDVYAEDWTSFVVFPEKDDIERIMENVVYSDYYDMNGGIHETGDHSYNVTAYTLDRNVQRNFGQYYSVSFVFRPGCIPDFVTKEVEENREYNEGY